MDAETQEIRQARQRASVKWLLSKAFNNRVPDNLKEPFYRDHENQERLKPQIIVDLGNSSLYCQTLSNLYSDPNYQSLNHWSILQTLTRKGVLINDSPDMLLNETVLIQTNPLKIHAHMLVIESLMLLYAKEISSGERIINAIRRISGNSNYQAPNGQIVEQQILAWVSHACAALKKRITNDVETGLTDDNGMRLQTPDIPPVRDFQDLCDGICLALLISYYCPQVLPWTSIRINYLPAVEDSIHNILLVSNFSQKHLPYSVFHMTPEDITYMRGSMKLNLVVLLTDFFNLFEIHPAKCVCYYGMDASDVIIKRNFGANEHGIFHRRGLTQQPVTPIPDLRSDLDSIPSGSPTNRPPFQVTRSASASVIMRKSAPIATITTNDYQTIDMNNYENHNHNEAFVVHKSRGITTLSSMHSHQQQQQQQQQQLQQQQQIEPLVPARLRQSKEKTNTETKADERGDFNVAAGRPSNWEQNRRPSYAGRRSRRNSSSEDSQLTIENFGGSQDQLNMIGRYERDRERDRDRERERKLSNASGEPAVAIRSSIADSRGTLQLGYDTDSGSEKQDREQEKYMRRQASVDNVSIAAPNAHINLNNDPSVPSSSTAYREHSADKDFNDSLSDSKANAYDNEVKLVRKSSTASMPVNPSWQHEHDPYDDDVRSLDASRLSTIRMKLEEKRRRIEQDKRRIEMAFLRQETDDLASEMGKWETLSNESKRTPDMDPLEMDKYQQSIAIMNMNLQDIQHDIQRLASQQNQIQAQHLQAHNLLHAQQIANMLNQQTYGSQQHLAEPFHQRSVQQQSFGSSPHIPQAFQPQVNAYNSRPPSRDPYHQVPPPMSSHMQYVNEHGQYMSTQQQQAPAQLPQTAHYMQPQSIYSDNASPYNNHSYVPQYGPPQHTQQQYMSNRAAPIPYDDFAHLQHGREPHSPQPVTNHNFYLHDTPPQLSQQQAPPTQRRTWAQPTAHESPQQQQQLQQQQQQSLLDVNAWQTQKKPSWTQPQPQHHHPQQQQHHPLYQQQQHQQHQPANSTQGFVLHQNGGGGEFQHLFQVHSSPQHVQRTNSNAGIVGVQRQQSMTNLRENRLANNMPKTNSQPQAINAQPVADDMMMAPQSICFIGDDEDVDEVERNIIESMQNVRISDYSQHNNHVNNINNTNNQQHQMMNNARGSSSEDYDSNELMSQKLHITSGNLTYRIPSPARPSLHANSFQDPREEKTPEKGFYISFDDEQPKRPKPPLRAKRSPKKERSLDSVDHLYKERKSLSQLHNNSLTHDGLNGTLEMKQTIGHLNAENNNKATYNKYTDAPPVNFKQLNNSMQNNENKTNGQFDQSQQQRPLSPLKPQSPTHNATLLRQQQSSAEAKSKALVIGADASSLDPESVDEMERRKEKILLLSMQRRQQQEEAKARKETEAQQKRELERQKEEERARKKEEQMARRAAILEQHRLKKAIEEAEREGKTLDRSELTMKQQASQSAATPRLRQQRSIRPRPKTIHVDDGSVDISEASSISSRGKKGSSTNLTGYGQLSSNTMKRDYYRGSQDSLTIKESPDDYPSTSSTPIGRRGSYKTSREPTTNERGRTLSRISVAKGSTLNLRGRKSNSLMNLCDTDSGLGRATPPRRAPSPGMATTSGRHLPSPSGPGSLPPGLISKRRGFDDGSSDNSMMEYSGPKLYKQPAAKSNRGIILNAVEYCVFPGAVNREAKQKVLEKIARSEAKHFLVLFRDAGCQFRALYSYMPETEQVCKLYGTGPSQVDEVMFDKFFKYNSGGKCFSQIHTKHLTVTIDAFTIHNSLWQGKKVQLPSKKDMALVI